MLIKKHLLPLICFSSSPLFGERREKRAHYTESREIMDTIQLENKHINQNQQDQPRLCFLIIEVAPWRACIN